MDDRTTKRGDKLTRALDRLAAAIEVANEQRDVEQNGPRG